jgi:hypothetical protein
MMKTIMVKVKDGNCPIILRMSYRAVKIEEKSKDGTDWFVFKVTGEQAPIAEKVCDELMDNCQVLDYTSY